MSVEGSVDVISCEDDSGEVVDGEDSDDSMEMDELMAQLEADTDDMAAFDNLLDKAASGVRKSQASAKKKEQDKPKAAATAGTSEEDSSEDGNSSQPTMVSRNKNSGSSTPEQISEGSSQPVLLSHSPRLNSESGSHKAQESPDHTHTETSPRSGSSAGGRNASPDAPAQHPHLPSPPDTHIAVTPVKTAAMQPHAQAQAQPASAQAQPALAQAQPALAQAQPASQAHAREPRSPPAELGEVFGSFWKSVSASATNAYANAEHIIHDPELSTRVNNFMHIASDELVSTAFDVSAAARAGNAKLLIKPLASLGVPLELIAYRECGDEDAEVCPEFVSVIIGVMEEHHQAHGRLSLSLFTRPLSAEDRERLSALKESIDNGIPLDSLKLGDDIVAAAADLLRWFLLELPHPLLTYALYADFLAASEAGEGAMSDVAQRMPAPCRATARRILSFLYTSVVQDAPNKNEMLRSLGLMVGPCILRSSEMEVVVLMGDALEWQRATSLALQHAETIFAHSCWFLGPWLGVYSLECVQQFSDDGAGEWVVKGGVGSLSELEIDADGLSWGKHKAKAGSEVNASHWGRSVKEGEKVNMVAAAKFESQTLVISFAGDSPQDGIQYAEQIIIEPDGKGGLQERVLRRFEGFYMKPLAWEARLDAWAHSNLRHKFDAKKHPILLQELWTMTYPEDDPPARMHEDWMRVGFSSSVPGHDFEEEETGMLVLDLLVYFSGEHNPKYRAVLQRSRGGGAAKSYSFVKTAVRVCDLLLRSMWLLGGEDAGVGQSWRLCGKEAVACRRALGMLLASKDDAFNEVFVTVMLILDDEWCISGQNAALWDKVVSRTVSRSIAALRGARPIK